MPEARLVVGRVGLAAALVAGLVAGLATAPMAALAADPPGGPAGHAPTCQERYPGDGPAGVDLQLGCVIAQLVGAYTGADSSDPAPLSSYLRPVAIVGLLVAAVAIALVVVRRRLGRRLAPVLAAEWWSCPACRSVNPAVATSCYSCGSPRTTDARPMARDDEERSARR